MAMVRDIEVRGMQHCETTALGVLLRNEGLDLSEPMLFGLGSGLSFVYWDSKAMGFPFLGGRVKPFELTRILAALLGLELLVGETTSPRKAWQNVAAPIDAGRPVGLQLD
ncbi:BtrH N-terminal domain-containing protein, partial [Streptomyces fulvoviolaceus]|uniref:BtrH N-terminal domain-containing protein n=1 Tax=Streptomyces fulvoviolaceus TaxID=285535 RepID=UPI0004C9061B